MILHSYLISYLITWVFSQDTFGSGRVLRSSVIMIPYRGWCTLLWGLVDLYQCGEVRSHHSSISPPSTYRQFGVLLCTNDTITLFFSQ